MYQGIFLLRRGLFVYTIFAMVDQNASQSFLQSPVWLQITLNNVLSLGYLVFMVVAKPFEQPFSRRIEVFAEFAFMTIVEAAFNVANTPASLYYTDMEVYLNGLGDFRDYTKVELIGYMLVSVILFSIAAQVFAHSFYLLHQVIQSIKYFLARGKFRTSGAD